MTYPTPQGLPPQTAEYYLRGRYGAYRGHFAWRELEEAFNAGLRAQAASVEPVARVDYSRRGNISWLFGPQVPDGAHLYAGAPPAHISGDVDSLRYATDLAMALAKKFYPEVPDFSTFDNLPGVLTQIDNITCGLVRLHPAHSPAQAVDAVGEPNLEKIIDEYLEYYEMVGESEDGCDACHTPSDGERHLIKDAIFGLLEVDEFKAWQARAALQASRHPQAQQGGGENTARAFIEWCKAQPEDRVPVSIDEALNEFEAALATKEPK